MEIEPGGMECRWGQCQLWSVMPPAVTRGANGTVVEEGERRRRQRQGNEMELPWAQCFGRTLMLFVFGLYMVIAAALLMLVVAAGFEKSWKMGLMISLILVLWGCLGGCGLHLMVLEKGHGRRVKEGRVKEGQVKKGTEGPGGAEMEDAQEVQEAVTGLREVDGGDGMGSVQEMLGDEERIPLLGPNPTGTAMVVAARAGALSGW